MNAYKCIYMSVSKSFHREGTSEHGSLRAYIPQLLSEKLW